MKKLILLSILTLALNSCSKDSSTAQPANGQNPFLPSSPTDFLSLPTNQLHKSEECPLMTDLSTEAGSPIYARWYLYRISSNEFRVEFDTYSSNMCDLLIGSQILRSYRFENKITDFSTTNNVSDLTLSLNAYEMLVSFHADVDSLNSSHLYTTVFTIGQYQDVANQNGNPPVGTVYNKAFSFQNSIIQYNGLHFK